MDVIVSFTVRQKYVNDSKVLFLWFRLSGYKQSEVQICILCQALLVTQAKHKEKWTKSSGLLKLPSYLKESEVKSKVC